jgi:hypothetical protein
MTLFQVKMTIYTVQAVKSEQAHQKYKAKRSKSANGHYAIMC